MPESDRPAHGGKDQPGWRGIIPVANTPFVEDGAVDLDSITAFADYIAKAGCDAALLRGVAAERRFSMHASELLVRSFADATRGRFDLIVGLSVIGRRALAQEARAAIDAGACAINWCPAPGTDAVELIATLSATERAGATKIMLQDFDIAGPGLSVAPILAAHCEVEAFCSIKVETNDNLAKAARLATSVQRPINPLRGVASDRDDRVFRCWHPRLHADRPRSAPAAHLPAAPQRRPIACGRSLRKTKPLHAFMTESLGRSIAVNKLLRQREGIFATDRCRHSQAVLEQAERAIAELLSGSALRLQVAESE